MKILQGGAFISLPREYVEQHDDEGEQDHDGARVDDDLGGGKELGAEERAPGLGSSSYVVPGSHSHYPAEFFLAVTSNISSKMYFVAMGATDLLPNGEESRAP